MSESAEPQSRARHFVAWWRGCLLCSIVEWLIVIGCVGFIIALAFIQKSHASDGAQSTTGIPIEWLFAAVGALGTIVYADIKAELRRSLRASASRDRKLSRVEFVLQQCAGKLGIHYPYGDSHEHTDTD